MEPVLPLDANMLRQPCDPDQFNFDTTAELQDLEEVIGQERAVDAISFGIGIQQKGFNLFALGPNGTGKYTSVHRSLKIRAIKEPAPPDWCYVFNFDQSDKPNALRLPAGRATILKQEMKRLVEELFVVIAAAFESDEYQNQRRAIESEFQGKQEAALEEIRREAEVHEIALIRTPSGLAFAPLADKEVIKPDEFMKLPEERRNQIETRIEELQQRLQSVILQVPNWLREGRQRVQELNQEVATFTVTPLFDELKAQFADLPEVLAYIEYVKADVVENNHMFVDSQENGAAPSVPGSAGSDPPTPKGRFTNRYQVNIVVDHGQSEGAPVIYEQNPTFANLFGRLEHVAQMGALLTDFTLIKPGAVHQANGGYLILDSRKLLLQPFAWEGLKQALQAEEIRIESPGQALSLISTVTLEPQPIPLNVKVVLLGERMLYYLMHEHDPDFAELFKVAADFEDQMERNGENNLAYARLVGTLARKESLRHFDRAAVTKIVEHGARLAGDSERLSTHMQSVADLLREADYWAGEDGADIVSSKHVQTAIDAQIRRVGRIKERVQESIIRETILVDTTGEKIGQINGLSVLMLGNYAFGRPSRITARVRMGKGEVIDIERQVELGGPLHSKGVLILSSYLGSRYAADRPLSLSASLVFEQSYGGVDGDSASSAELYALLSALAAAPVKQSLAVTGSVNQHGQVQAIGGVNEKIEGFYDICEARGLTGDQGVLIPAANVKHLMLRQDVVEAVMADKFHIYPIETIEQGIEVLTSKAAGEMDAEGIYPDGTINRLVIDRLETMAETQRDFNRPPKETTGQGQNGNATSEE